MGEKLLQYYKYISEEMSIIGKVELAKQTKIPSAIAATEPDSKENLEFFRKTVEKITGKPAPYF